MSMSDHFSTIADTLGIVLAVPTLYAAVKYLTKERRREKQLIRTISQSNGYTNAALAISIGGPSIRVDVETFLRNNPDLKSVTGGIKFHEFHYAHSISEDKSALQIEEIMIQIRIIENHLKEQGVQRVHLFYAGPTIVATMIGAELANRFRILCYQRPRASADIKENYVCWGLMQQN